MVRICYLKAACILLLLIMPFVKPQAAEFNVPAGDVKALIDAILAANTNRDASNTINLARNSVYELRTAYVMDYKARDNKVLGSIGLPAITKDLTINGNGSIIRRLNSAPLFRIIVVDIYVDIIINQLTIEGGHSEGEGGGMYKNTGGTLTLKEVKFINNRADGSRGGGINIQSRNSTIVENCEFKGNKVKNIGGGLFSVLANLKVVDTKFVENQCYNMATDVDTKGGGIYVDGAIEGKGKIELIKVLFLRNEAHYQGGGLHIFLYDNDEAIIDQCEFSENILKGKNGSSFGGGAILFGNVKNNTTLGIKTTVSNCLFYKNISASQGGGAWLSRGEYIFQNTTLVENEAAGGGAVLLNLGNMTVNNCTIAGNKGRAGVGGVSSNASTVLSLSNSIFSNNNGTNNRHHANTGVTIRDLGNNLQYRDGDADRSLPTTIRVANPLLLPLADNGGPTRTMALQKGSPAIDAGNNCTPTDQRGQRRIGQCDIGAFEYVPEVSTPTVPNAPSSLTATANSTTQITLNWSDNATNETGFKIERSTTAGSGFTEIAQVGADVTTFSNTNLQAGTTYFYRVRAYNNAGNSAYSNEASATTLQPAPAVPNAPTNLKATSPLQGQIVLNWEDNATNETGFKIERSTTTGSGFAEIAQVTANTTTYTDNNLTLGATFFYRVRAYNAAGNSAYSNEASVVVTALNQTDISNLLNIYPNPTADRLSFKLDFKKQGNFQIRITDLTGRIMVSEIWNKNTDVLYKDLSLHFLSSGIYLVYVYNEDYKAIKKLVKE